MACVTKKPAELLYKIEQMITNGQAHSGVSAAMAVYGYDATRWAETHSTVAKLCWRRGDKRPLG